MRHLSFAALTLCLLLALPRTTRAGQITYDIQNYPADQSGHTVSGTITTDGTIGPLAVADITSWVVTFDNTFTFRSTDQGSFTVVEGAVQATPTSITLSNPSAGVNALELDITPPQGGQIAYQRGPQVPGGTPYYHAFELDQLLWLTFNPTLGGPDPWILAVASASVVPEPSSLWMAGIATSVGLAYGWSRHRRDQRRQGSA